MTPGSEVGSPIEATSNDFAVVRDKLINDLVIPIKINVESIIFKVLFNCFTNLFLRFIILFNLFWLGQVFKSSNFCPINSVALDIPNSATNPIITGIKVSLSVIICSSSWFWM